MQTRVKYYFVAMVLFFACSKIVAQIYPISDSGFKTCLSTDYPGLLDGNKDLIIANANALNDTLDCSSRKIKNADGLQFFTSITTLDFSDNEIDSFPEIAGLVQLVEINVHSNELENTDLPSFETFTALKSFKANYNQLDHSPDFPVQVEEIYLGNNSLGQTFDASLFSQLSVLDLFENDVQEINGFENLNNLKSADLHTNELKRDLDLSTFTQLKHIDLRENEYENLPLFNLNILEFCGVAENMLTFEDFIPLTHSNYFPDSFPVFSSQLMPEISQTYTQKEGGEWKWELSFDKDVSNSTYFWYKEGQLIQSTSEGVLLLQNLALSDSGKYHCEIINSTPKLEGVRIVTNTQTLVVHKKDNVVVPEPNPDPDPEPIPEPAFTCFEFLHLEHTIENPSCQSFAIVSLAVELTGEIQGELRYVLTSETNSYSFDTSTFTIYEEGDYEIKLQDDSCIVNTNESITIHFDTDNCEPASFSPNGDGVDDEFYIEAEGYTQIYDPKGKLVREIQSPALWDGTDNSGTPLPFGYYIMQTGNIISGVSLMK